MHIPTLIQTLYIHTVDASAGLPRTCLDLSPAAQVYCRGAVHWPLKGTCMYTSMYVYIKLV